MKRALVLGASGGMGFSIVNELIDRGVEVVAFARSEQKLKALYQGHQGISIQTGDIFNLQDVVAASEHVDVIFQAANIPYSQWEDKLILFIGNVLKAAEINQTKLVLIENIYAYGRSTGAKISESTPKRPNTKKGKIRLQVEQLVQQRNVPTIIAHFPDFYGPNAENTLLHFTLKNAVQHKKAMFIGNRTIAREFIYTPDGAKAVVNLAMHDNTYGQNWNIPATDIVTGEELIQIIRDLTGYDKPVSTVSKNLIRFLGIFNADMRETVEMFYLNEEPVVLDGSKYENEIGPLPRTSYRDGLQRTMEYMTRSK
ncbi:NAD-dependent epimerase/dehydratase [Bacillus sp. OxB-1]|uniref:SDR family NAD(P)-dependent oxidoreductase n=1 Tax=Bacillus sp. (strain OxB-1) TaxID=98228 RepID=UPI00058205BA|nr:SDR family NAD(P)-dependent oxidoreductase [Bacillus sp. OxB-1]BAQ09533.1 NAD-dependent epimerase/dehydratase [Bacillus sp. OxB-1]